MILFLFNLETESVNYNPEKDGGKVCVCALHLGLSVHVSVCLTEGHPATDNLRTLFHVCDGGYRKTPVCYGTPEML